MKTLLKPLLFFVLLTLVASTAFVAPMMESAQAAQKMPTRTSTIAGATKTGNLNCALCVAFAGIGFSWMCFVPGGACCQYDGYTERGKSTKPAPAAQP